MEILSKDEPNLTLDTDDIYLSKYGTTIWRTGKAFSYTFWRTQLDGDVFWSVQGNDPDGGAWITTQYFGPPERISRFIQEIVLPHPMETKISMEYTSPLLEGRNCCAISRTIIQHFKNDDNSFNFQFRIVRLKKRNRRKH